MYFYAPEIRGHIGGIQYLGPCGALRGLCAFSSIEERHCHTGVWLNQWYYIMGFGKDGKGVIIRESRTQALGTLAQDVGIIVGTKIATLERFRMLKSICYAGLTGLTATEGQQLMLYLADGNFTIGEINACINNQGPFGPNDEVEEELSERMVVLVGAVSGVDIGGVQAHIHDMNTNAPVCVAKPRWTFARTKSWNWVIFNRGAALTTGSSARILAKNFGVWVL